MAIVTSSTASPYASLLANQTSSSSNSSSSQANSTGTDALSNESTFLTLLVSQLKNQNPLNPMDGTTFVTQLAQFSDLEQNLAMRQDLDSINGKYTGSAAAASQSGATSSPAKS